MKVSLYKMKEIRVKVTFIEDLLGTATNNKEVYREYIASKGPDPTSIEDEVADVVQRNSVVW